MHRLSASIVPSCLMDHAAGISALFRCPKSTWCRPSTPRRAI